MNGKQVKNGAVGDGNQVAQLWENKSNIYLWEYDCIRKHNICFPNFTSSK